MGKLRGLCENLYVREWLLATGWAGTDGSSWSFDDVQGVRIGNTGWNYSTLPATCHDVAYELIRRFQPPGRKVRREADRLYRVMVQERIKGALVPKSLSSRVGQAQAWGRWLVLRVFGGRAARPRH